LRDY